MAERSAPDADAVSKVSRRAFLKTAGVSAAASSLASLTPAAAAPVVLGPDAVPLQLKINGALHTLSVEPRTTLLRALRNQLELTGAKEVCDRGACGACTVLLDGRPVNACLLLALDAEGHELTTVEGLGTPQALHPVHAAFVECDALQCGFCTPGFVVAASALLKQVPNPSLEQIKAGLAGNLCRCGTYGRVFEAVQKAAAHTPAPRRGAAAARG